MSTLKVNNVQDLGADDVIVNGVIDKAALPTGSILQVLQSTRTSNFSTSSTSLVDITDLTLAITPRATTSKILILADVLFGSTDGTPYIQLVRDSTDIYKGTSGTGINATKFRPIFGLGNGHMSSPTAVFLDSPNTTSQIVYRVRIACSGAGQTAWVNRTGASDLSASASSITLLEVAG